MQPSAKIDGRFARSLRKTGSAPLPFPGDDSTQVVLNNPLRTSPVRSPPPTSKEPAALNLRISDPTLAPALAEYLRAQRSYVVAERRDGSVDVSVLGSAADGGRIDVELYLRAWEAAHEVTVEAASDH